MENSENLEPATEENAGAAAPAQNPEAGSEQNKTGIRDLIAKGDNTSNLLNDANDGDITINFDNATPEERQAFFDKMPKIGNLEIYKDLNIAQEGTFADLPKILAEQKISPEQIKPVLDYYDQKVISEQEKLMDAEDYDAKLHKYMGDDFEKYHQRTDDLFIKYVPNELRQSMVNAPNDLMVAMKAVLTNVVKEYDAMFEQIKNDYGVDPSEYKLGSLKNKNMPSVETRRKDLVNQIWTLNQEGKREEAYAKNQELLKLLGVKQNAED